MYLYIRKLYGEPLIILADIPLPRIIISPRRRRFKGARAQDVRCFRHVREPQPSVSPSGSERRLGFRSRLAGGFARGFPRSVFPRPRTRSCTRLRLHYSGRLCWPTFRTRDLRWQDSRPRNELPYVLEWLVPRYTWYSDRTLARRLVKSKQALNRTRPMQPDAAQLGFSRLFTSDYCPVRAFQATVRDLLPPSPKAIHRVKNLDMDL